MTRWFGRLGKDIGKAWTGFWFRFRRLTPLRQIAKAISLSSKIGAVLVAMITGANAGFDFFGHIFPDNKPPVPIVIPGKPSDVLIKFSNTSPRLDCHVKEHDWLIWPFETSGYEKLEGGDQRQLLGLIDGIVGRIQDTEHATGQRVVGVALIGSTDQRELKPGRGVRSNPELAQSRADFVGREIRRAWSGELAPSITVVPRGAQIVGAGIAPKAEGADRSVQLCIYWG